MSIALSGVLAACAFVRLSAGYALAGTGGGGIVTDVISVPEPTSLALIAGAAAAVAWAKFRKR